jgi:stearoyl-CoA desaturase (delta-9 desaturase)
MAAPLIKRDRELDRIRWIDNVPFWGVHAAAVVGLAMVGFSWLGVALCAASYVVRMFGITAGYHRYFSHRTYKTSRFGQVVLALLGVISTQKGPLWWAAHHRNHHKYSDEPEDIHSPRQRGFWWSHMFWILVERHKKADMSKIKDLTKYPELVFIDRFEILFTVAYATRWPTSGASAATRPPTTAATTSCWRCSPAVRAGTTTTTTTSAPPARASTGGRSTRRITG